MKTFYLMTMGFCLALNLHAQRSEYLLEKGWKFTKGEVSNAEMPAFNDAKWETVDIPHDWAILGPFDKNNDLQNVAVTQNFETQASLKTGRTGGLPYVGIGWYRTTFHSTPGKQTTLIFDGAMSEASKSKTIPHCSRYSSGCCYCCYQLLKCNDGNQFKFPFETNPCMAASGGLCIRRWLSDDTGIVCDWIRRVSGKRTWKQYPEARKCAGSAE